MKPLSDGKITCGKHYVRENDLCYSHYLANRARPTFINQRHIIYTAQIHTEHKFPCVFHTVQSFI